MILVYVIIMVPHMQRAVAGAIHGISLTEIAIVSINPDML